MATDGAGTLLQHLCRAARPRGCDATDGLLLGRFVARGDPAAFEALVRRHGPMVLGVCRRVLRHAEDAEDAFQAAFLVLARKAGVVVPREAVGNWLYGVAYRTALQARSVRARRRAKERQVSDTPHPEARPDESGGELRQVLDRELSRLPDKYRLPVVLCELEGRGRKEVARQLGLPEGTLSWRLAAARKMLARRLSGYGPPAAGVALAALAAEGATAAVPGPLVISTVRAAAGATPARVAALAEGVLKTMLIAKLKASAGVFLLAVSVTVGAVGLSYRTAAAQAPPPAAGQSLRDELDALRLEVEALRKGLQATRGRVQVLEGEVAALRANPALRKEAANTQNQENANAIRGLDLSRQSIVLFDRSAAVDGGTLALYVADPLGEADAALQKLRKNPGDREALAALEQAVKRMKDGTKSEIQLRLDRQNNKATTKPKD